MGVRRVQSGALTLGELLLVMTYLTQLYEPLRHDREEDRRPTGLGRERQRVLSVLDRGPDLVERPTRAP